MPIGTGSVKTFVLTLTGGATVDNLMTLAGLVKGGTVDTEPVFVELHFEADGANANVAYVGSAGMVVSSTNYGFQLPVGATRYSKVFQAAHGGLKLSSFEAIGTATQKINVMGVI
jgi:hypothetical protein